MMRGLMMLLRVSVIAMPVFCRAELIPPTEAYGVACLKSAKAPATWGRCHRGPGQKVLFALPGRAEMMLVPGSQQG